MEQFSARVLCQQYRAIVSKALHKSALAIAGIKIEQAGENREVFAHGRAFSDYCPIGTWGIDSYDPAEVRHMYIDGCKQGGRSDSTFYFELVPGYGFKTMVHTGATPEFSGRLLRPQNIRQGEQSS